MVLTHLTHSIDNTVPIAFNITGQQFPDTIKYYQEIKELWNLKVYELKPKMTFWEIVKTHGYPKTSRNTKTGNPREPACCKILKYDPMKEFIKSHEIDLNFVGLIGDEGRQRRMCYLMKGQVTYLYKELRIMKCVPLIWWTKEDIWHYHDIHNIPRNPVYAKYGIDRTGCMACTGYLNWKEQMIKVSFPLYRKVSNEMGQPLIEDYTNPQGREVPSK